MEVCQHAFQAFNTASFLFNLSKGFKLGAKIRKNMGRTKYFIKFLDRLFDDCGECCTFASDLSE